MTGILNFPGLHELDLKELEFEYHVKAEPAAISRMCPNCGELHRVQKHGSRLMFIRDLPTHGKTMMIHLDVPRLICLSCKKTFMAVVAEVDADLELTYPHFSYFWTQTTSRRQPTTFSGYPDL